MGDSCTFTETGKKYVNQMVYRCRTCKLVGNLGTCYACVMTCHRGHDTFYHHYGTFFCDCGERGAPFCKLVTAQALSDSNVNREVFECTVCMMPMTAPIFMCEHGHNLCATCREKVEMCPLCRGKLTGARNLALETLSRSLVLDCEDCSESVVIAEFGKHKNVCTMSQYPCPLQPACSWIGFLWNMLDHCRTEHAEKIRLGQHHEFTHTKFMQTKDFESNLIVIGDTIFLYHRQYDKELAMFQAVVKHANTGQDSKFTYTLTFTTSDGEESTIIKKRVRPVHEDVEEIYSLYNGAVLYMSQTTMFSYLGSLKYTLNISPV